MMKKILLADDHSLIRRGLANILQDEYVSVEIKEVADGESLVKEALLNDYDLVITDLEMPGIGGMEALEKIKSKKHDLPVLVLSIYSEDLYALRALKSGASGYLNKSSAPDELVKVIHRIESGKKYISTNIAEKLASYLEKEKQPHDLLSNKEFEVFKLLAMGKRAAYISENLSLALNTINTYRSRIMHKLELTNNAELTRYAINHHILSEMDI